jgi:hypothetical protein
VVIEIDEKPAQLAERPSSRENRGRPGSKRNAVGDPTVIRGEQGIKIAQ